MVMIDLVVIPGYMGLSFGEERVQIRLDAKSKEYKSDDVRVKSKEQSIDQISSKNEERRHEAANLNPEPES